MAASSIAVSRHDLHVLFSKASIDQRTVENFNTVLDRLKDDGILQKLIDKYSQ
jgi:ABC-type amino acid transport substrate-binding protein